MGIFIKQCIITNNSFDCVLVQLPSKSSSVQFGWMRFGNGALKATVEFRLSVTREAPCSLAVVSK